jgi:hypothetical protein
MEREHYPHLESPHIETSVRDDWLQFPEGVSQSLVQTPASDQPHPSHPWRLNNSS